MINMVEELLIQMGHEPVRADQLIDTSSWFDMSKAAGLFIQVLHYTGGNTDLVLTVHEGVTGAGTTAITTGAEFPIWVCASALTDQTLVRQADGLGYSVDADVLTGSCIVLFYIPSAILTAGYRYVQLGASGGHASSIASVMYYGVGARFKGAENM